MLPWQVASQGTRSNTVRTQQAALARALESRQRHTLLYFYSSRCALCQSLAPEVDEAGSSNASLLDVARICTDDQLAWAPEMLNYDVESVPCMVLLNTAGDAIAKSSAPRSRPHMTSALNSLVTIAATNNSNTASKRR